MRRFELETGEFDHPDLRQGARIQCIHQGIERRRRDIAAGDRRHAGAIQQMGGQRRGRRLAVAAGDGDDLRARCLLADAGGEQLDFRDYRHVNRSDRRRRLRHARRQRDEVDAGKGRRGKRPGNHFGRRRDTGQPFQVRRVAARIGDTDERALAMQPLGHRQPGLAESDYQNAFALEFHQRNFKVDSPISTSMMVMIQKRTTTCVSFQPDCSKW